MNEHYSVREIEYSKKWAAKNPELFTNNILEFIEQHPSEHWSFSMTCTTGMFTIKATLSKAAGGQ